ncbi:hypothetical protein PHLGIDRAFT_111877 [Phlebiopsis gigantea 11061_1 CR5-6]|uniref:Defective in cullin neddylation protein n=1 Tax=Phlebiopsis gigantea (strain 11061_1 CR5-6) TaxID=745531 RepID=A0A0C3S3V9_PHLG1|nr:hypothetical protein PHLGIDRAFT_111877 [Phlebiopsis gigantea 11061_1 CR5-6]
MKLTNLLCCTTRSIKLSEDVVSAPPRTNGERSTASLESSTSKAKSAAPKPSPSDPYTPARAMELFSLYADADDPDVIGPEGFERLCNDADIPLEGAMPLILAWLVKGDEMAKITRREWETGMGELQIASPAALSIALQDFNDLLLSNKLPLKPPTSSPDKRKKLAPEPYNRARYYRCAGDRRKTFAELYQFCFVLAKPPQARLIDMETGSAFWSVLLVPQYPIMQEILDFISEKGTYRGVNKDLWSMVLEFCRTVSLDLHDYEVDGAWPTLLDEFVTWKKSKSTET